MAKIKEIKFIRIKEQEDANVFRWYEAKEGTIIASLVQGPFENEAEWRISGEFSHRRITSRGGKELMLKNDDKENIRIINRLIASAKIRDEIEIEHCVPPFANKHPFSKQIKEPKEQAITENKTVEVNHLDLIINPHKLMCKKCNRLVNVLYNDLCEKCSGKLLKERREAYRNRKVKKKWKR